MWGKWHILCPVSEKVWWRFSRVPPPDCAHAWI